ncbi:helix-turn-helix domain-containing protein [Armatimonas rosea]|uniref:AraC family transcriptional regulator of arabinose operon n=1 Tax=Armatimonas rosea TaxID=685828 RepID=A0A7W9SME1_ARMRO|nr:helix-turn-helix domain-containing protein [Armatimonas rosea]MBB6049015.1 AraC family transcriptional regulator of arabinose operon [Armatimonas rosea]
MAENLKYSASRRDDYTPSAAPIVTGVLQGDSRYTTWRARGTQDYLLMLTLTGCGRVGHARGEVRVEPGELVLIRPGTRHDYGTARGASHWELVWAHFQPRPHWLEWLTWPEPAPGILHLALTSEQNALVESALRLMDTRARSAAPHRAAWAMHGLEEALLHCAAALPSAQRHDSRVAAAMAYLIENLAQPLTLTEVAASTGLSVSRLSHRFKDEVGITPGQFLERERLARAAQLLQLTTRPIAAIAEEVGFASPIHFSLRFKKAFGHNPRAFRKLVP